MGDFQFIPTYDDAEDNHITEKKVDAIKNKFVDKSDVF